MKSAASFPVHRIACRRGGFTLIEMLVSTALVMLIMVLFAQIYAAATSTIREQEGNSKNDQKARSVDIVLQSDLKNRTFRGIPSDRFPRRVGPAGLIPLQANFPVTPFQAGYFAISENDPGCDTDDVLSFTIFAPDGEVFYGPCLAGTEVNHPDSDDGISNDSRTASRAAEVVYFLRDGILYRRINLLRDPPVIPDANSRPIRLPTQPTSGTAGVGPVLWTTEPANWKQTCTMASTSVGTAFTVLGIESLSNSLGLANYPIGMPRFRYGHNGTTGNPDSEYSGSTFQGRQTLGEWSGGSLNSRDILLSNVTAFDIKVWEPQDADANGTTGTGEFPTTEGVGGRFVDLGHGDTDQGIFAKSNTRSTWGQQNTTYGAASSTAPNRNIFDTWHPKRTDAVPFAPLKVSGSGTNLHKSWGASKAWNSNSDWTQSDILFPRAGTGDFSYGYRVVTSGTTGTIPPGGGEWPYQPGRTVTDNSVQWECFDNRIGLTMVRVTIHYRDPGSELIRQVTIDHSFVD